MLPTNADPCPANYDLIPQKWSICAKESRAGLDMLLAHGLRPPSTHPVFEVAFRFGPCSDKKAQLHTAWKEHAG
jgi:hypothetical protein